MIPTRVPEECGVPAQELILFASGQSKGAPRRQILEHLLAGCARCRETLAALKDLDGDPSPSAASQETEDAASVSRILASLGKIGREFHEAVLDLNPADEPVSFVEPTGTQLKNVVIDVMVAYTKKSARSYSDIEQDLIALAIEETNESFRASNLGHIKLRLVHAYQTDYAEDGTHFDHVWRFADKGDGHMEEVHGLRDKYRADVAILVVDDDKGCGLATRVNADAEDAFAVVHHACAAASFFFASWARWIICFCASSGAAMPATGNASVIPVSAAIKSLLIVLIDVLLSIIGLELGQPAADVCEPPSLGKKRGVRAA